MEMVFEILPVPKGRHRMGVRHRRNPFGRRCSYPVAYSERKTEVYEKQLSWLMARAWTKLPTKERLSVSVTFFRPTKRGDLDNLLKAVLDAGNKIIWYDDRIIDQIYCKVERSFTGLPRIVLTVEKIGGGEV